MLKEAEENAEADKNLKEAVEAKNHLESYLYNLKNSVEDSLKDKISNEDKAVVNTAVTDALSWLEENPSQQKDVYENKRKEVENIANPIITKAYNSDSSSKNPSSDNDDSNGSNPSREPSVEEVD